MKKGMHLRLQTGEAWCQRVWKLLLNRDPTGIGSQIPASETSLVLQGPSTANQAIALQLFYCPCLVCCFGSALMCLLPIARRYPGS